MYPSLTTHLCARLHAYAASSLAQLLRVSLRPYTRSLPALVAVVLVLAAPVHQTAAQPVIYVDADAVGNADGSSWAHAFNQLNRALDAAGNAAQIWVAEGTYWPTTDSDRAASFNLKNDVVLYGGFQGGETQHDQRNPDPLTNGTILSGHIAGDDVDDNSYHVVSAIGVDNTAVLDGFTITGGYADSSGQHDRGGGLTNWDGSSSRADNEGYPVLRNVRFVENTAQYGGAVYLNHTVATARIENAAFEANTADRGGALYANGEVDIEETSFTGNVAQVQGGALWLFRDSSVELEDVEFEENTAVSGGGAVYTSGELEVEDGVFTSNEVFSGRGGAIYSTDNELTLVGSRFVENEAEDEGGAVATLSSRLVLVQGYFAMNDGNWGGGLWCGGGGTCEVTNTVFVGGGADEEGGGIHNSWSTLTLTNATVSGNEKGGYTADGTTFGDLRNSIFWDNADVQVEAGTAQVRFSVVEGGYAGGTSIVAEDPRFVRAVGEGGDDDLGDLRLQSDSPALDFGDDSFLPQDDFDLDEDDITGETLPLDLNGAVRVQAGRIDLGAYEGASSSVASEGAAERPDVQVLEQNYPNPFNSATTIRYTLAEPADVRLRVFDLLGREVATPVAAHRASGTHSVTFDGSHLPAGVYFYQFEVGSQRQVRTMTRAK